MTAPKPNPRPRRGLSADPTKRGRSAPAKIDSRSVALPIDGAEIVTRVAAALERDLKRGAVSELLRGLAWSYGAVAALVAFDDKDFNAEDFQTLANEAVQAFDDGRAEILTRARDAAKGEGA